MDAESLRKAFPTRDAIPPDARLDAHLAIAECLLGTLSFNGQRKRRSSFLSTDYIF